MIDREWLEAFATGKPTDEAVAALQKAIRGAIDVANDNLEADDEHVAFVTAIIAALGLKRPPGRPSKVHLAKLAANIVRFRHWQGRNLTHGEIARALVEPGVVSETTIRNHLRTIDKRRTKVHALLASDAARQGMQLLTATMKKGPPKRAIIRRSSLMDVPHYISAGNERSDGASPSPDAT